VKHKLNFELGRREFAEHVDLMISREAATNVARLMERFESFMKDVFSAVLCYDPAQATELGATVPMLVTSIDITRQWANKTRIPAPPFSKQKANGSGIREFLQVEFPAFRAISKGDNVFNLDYDALMAVLILLRHDITHSEMFLGDKTMHQITMVQLYFSTVINGTQTVLAPTEQQMRNVFDKVTEYAFAIAKFLSMQYRLAVAHYTYSDKPSIMLREGKWPIG
jgi:hypothetical protein